MTILCRSSISHLGAMIDYTCTCGENDYLLIPLELHMANLGTNSVDVY